jgi:putative magnesium chelatase accessory protein
VSEAADWDTDGSDWPNREASHFVTVSGLRWHYQRLGAGPTLLLIHGTGAATHSWRSLAPQLARHFDVIAPDLPGHGFTASPESGRMSLPGIAEDTAALLQALAVEPDLVAGHSAGAAILARMCLDRRIRPAALISINGALLPAGGLYSAELAPVARLLLAHDGMARLLARGAGSDGLFGRVLRSTGSTIDAQGAELYRRLARKPRHVAAVLDMMTRWDVRTLARELPSLPVPLTLLAGELDAMVPASEANRVRELLPAARVIRLPGLGHLAHEERPAAIAELIVECARRAGLTGARRCG